MKSRILTPVLAVLFLSAGFAQASGDLWMTDFQAAKAKAAKENKSLLVDFTGSDWCGWCIKLHNEVFSKDYFKKHAPEDFVLVELDYPRDKSKLTKEQIEQNNKLRDEYEIRGYPTVLLMDAQGNVFAKTGYRKGGPEAYIKHLAELSEGHKKFMALVAKAEKAEGLAKAKLLDEALESKGNRAFLDHSDLVDRIIAIDAENEAGLKNKYECRRAIADLSKMPRDTTAQQMLEKVNAIIAKYQPTGKELQPLLLFKGISALRENQFEQGRDILTQALDAAPESEMADQIKRIIGMANARIKAQDKDKGNGAG